MTPQRTLKALDLLIRRGYRRDEAGDSAGAATLWLEAWPAVLEAMAAAGVETLSEFDEVFQGRACIFNWVQDLEVALWNAGIDDERFVHEGLRYCEDFLARFGQDERPVLENMRRALGNFHAALGDLAKADELFRGWLGEDPAWGWGWLGWADCYRSVGKTNDVPRAESILKDGLATPGVRHRLDLLDHLAILYDEMGRDGDARKLREQLEEQLEEGDFVCDDDFEEPGDEDEVEVDIVPEQGLVRWKTRLDFGPAGLPLDRLDDVRREAESRLLGGAARKVGRNERCPCGSGKKYKKCCGR